MAKVSQAATAGTTSAFPIASSQTLGWQPLLVEEWKQSFDELTGITPSTYRKS